MSKTKNWNLSYQGHMSLQVTRRGETGRTRRTSRFHVVVADATATAAVLLDDCQVRSAVNDHLQTT